MILKKGPTFLQFVMDFFKKKKKKENGNLIYSSRIM